MKNALLALALFAFAGSAAAHDGNGPKDPNKKAAAKTGCTRDMAAKSGCCMKGKATATTDSKTTPAPVVKSL